MKTKLHWLMTFCLLFSIQSFFAQQTDSETLKPIHVGKPTKVEKVPSIASRSSLVRPDLTKSEEMMDGRASKYDIVIGKGSTGDDALAKNPHRLKNKIPSKAPLLVFETGASTSQPTDPAGAVGPNHYISVINTAFQIFDKNGNSLTGGLVTPNPTIFPSGGCCDLTASYDNVADRWVLSFLGSGAQIAVSDGPNPMTSGWTVYTYGAVVDYQKLSVWHDGYYMTDNDTGTFHVFERDEMLAGNPGVQLVSFTVPGWQDPGGFTSPQFFNLSHNITATGPATMVYFADDSWGSVTQDDHIKLWSVTMDWNNTSNSSVTGPTRLGVDGSGNADGSVTPFISTFDGGSFVNLAQPSGGTSIDALQWTVMNQAQFRKFGSYNSALFNFVVDVDGSATEQAGVRWYELRQTGDGQPWTIHQEGTYTAPDNKHAWNASMIMDVQGNIGMGYTGMSSANSTNPNVRVGSYYTGQMASSSGTGTMDVAEEVIISSDANIPGTRYGDYSKIDIDPSDDKKFWFVNEVMSGGRKNVAGVFQLAPNTTNDVGVVSIDTPITGDLSNSEVITVTLFNFGEDPASGFDVTYQIDGGSVITETYLGTLASQTSEQFVFGATADLSTEGQTYTITSCTDYATDEDNGNDCTSANVTHEFANDIGVTAITAPETGTFLGNETVTVTIENFGTADQTGFDVNYILDGGTPVVETVGVNVPAGGSISYSFAQTADLSALGSYDFTSSTLLVGDSDTSNDSAMATVVNSSCLTLSDSPNLPVGPDGGTITTATFYVGNNFSIEDVNVTVDITHTYSGDITITLTSPDDTEVVLSDQNGDDGENYTNTTFDDDAATSITAGTAPFTGVFQPEGSLADFNGLQSPGIWTLTITDNAGGDGGTLNSWDLELCGNFTISANDIGVNFITAPVSGEGLGSETISITIGNYGTDPQSGFDVNYSIDGGTPVVETVAATVNPGSSIAYDFTTPADLSAFDTYVITSSTLLAGDGDSSNDSATTSVTNFMCQTETNSTVQAIGPNAGTVTTSIINFTDDFTISDVNVTLDITHSWDSDLDVKLIAPDGITEVILFEDIGSSGDNFTDTVLDDEAGTAITAGSAPFTGTFRPQGNLSDFDGMSSAGNWTLSITDDTNGDGGTLNSWDLQLCGNANLSVDDFLVEANMTIIYEGNKQFLIKLPGGTITDRLQMRVENMLGQTLLWKTLENEGNQGYEYRLNMSYASSGVYFVRIGNGKTENVKRIIVD